MIDVIDYGENVAAISAALHQDKDSCQRIYDNLPDDVGGFVGLWSFCAVAAKVFSEEEKPYTAGEDYCWIDAIEDYAQSIIGYLSVGNIPTDNDMRRLAGGAIEKELIHR
jgi:hypothetical protein